jgi:chromosome segregation ATPase
MVYTGEMAEMDEMNPQSGGGTGNPAEGATPAARLDEQRIETLVIMEKRAAAIHQAWRESLQTEQTALKQKLFESEQSREAAKEAAEDAAKAAKEAAEEAARAAEARVAAAEAAAKEAADAREATAEDAAEEAARAADTRVAAAEAAAKEAADARVAAANAAAKEAAKAASEKNDARIDSFRKAAKRQLASNTDLHDTALARFLQRVGQIAKEIDEIADKINKPQSQTVMDIVLKNQSVHDALKAGDRSDAERMKSVLTNVLGAGVVGLSVARVSGGRGLMAEPTADVASFTEGSSEGDSSDSDDDGGGNYIPSFGRPLLF